MPFWNTWARAPSFLFPVQMVLGAPSFPFPEHVGGALGAPPFSEHVGGALGAPPFPFPVHFWRQKIEAGRGTCANGSRAGPYGNRDTWSDQRVRLERGPLSVPSLQLHLYCRSHPEWWNPDSFDGPEDTYVHHKEDSANYNERSSPTKILVNQDSEGQTQAFGLGRFPPLNF